MTSKAGRRRGNRKGCRLSRTTRGRGRQEGKCKECFRVVGMHDIRVVQRRCRSYLAFKTLESVRVVETVFTDQFDGSDTPEIAVAGFPCEDWPRLGPFERKDHHQPWPQSFDNREAPISKALSASVEIPEAVIAAGGLRRAYAAERGGRRVLLTHLRGFGTGAASG